MKTTLISIIVICLVSFVLIALIYKGRSFNGVLDYQYTFSTEVGSPYELSNSTARYALVEAIVENQTFFLTETQAKFAAPDVVDHKGKFLSIFTPGITFLAIPFYMAGKLFGVPQISAYLLNSVFLLVNIFLVALLSRKLGAGKYVAFMCGLIFAFATNALPYSQTLTQHLVSSAVLVGLALIAAFGKNPLLLLFGGLLYGFGVLVDFPNGIMGLPAVFYILHRAFSFGGGKKPKLDYTKLLFFVGIIPMVILFAYYNFTTTGSFTTLAQSIGRTDKFNPEQPVHKLSEYPDSPKQVNRFKLSSIIPFNTRAQLNGLYILAISNERSWIFYSPLLIFGLLGLIVATKKEAAKSLAVIGLSICAIDLLVYSSFGDPWGGWAFGPRYLIPAAAIAAAGIGVVAEKFKRRLWFWPIFIPLLMFSIWINTLGVLTTNAIPPKVEAINLPDPIPYTPQYNLELFNQGMNTSIFYGEYLRNSLMSNDFMAIYLFLVSMFIMSFAFLAIQKERSNEQ